MKKWLFNPFIYVAGGKALVIGLLVMAATAVTGYYSNAHFDGVIDMHVGKVSPLLIYLIEQVVDWSLLAVTFFAAGKLFSTSSIRIIDIAGTLALARWPALFSAVIGFGIQTPEFIAPEKLLASVTPTFVALSLLSVVFMIWMIALMYNAFTVSCNMKGGKAVGIFITGLLIAEILSKLILFQVYK
jgi:hypothetical protein